MTERPFVTRSDGDGVATLTLDRPEQYNALSLEMIESLAAALAEVGGDDRVRVVVLAGAGKAFSAGHDLRQMRAREDRAFHLDLFERCTRLMTAILELDRPVIARVHGIATAAGCQLVATADLAIAASDARFAVSGVNLGLFCSTPSVALSRNVPVKRAFEMAVTGDFIDADTACAWGLVNRVVPAAALDAAVAELAAKILAKPAVAVATGKSLFYRQLERSRDEAYRIAARAMADNLAHADAREGIDAFLEKRAPDWKR